MELVLSGARRASAAACAALLALVVLIAPAAAGEPAIWQVQGGPGAVWLFGTLDLLPPETEWQTPLALAAFGDADVLVVEVREDPEAIAATRKIIKRKAFLGDVRKLRDHLSPEEQVTYEMIGNRLGMFPAILDNYRPWYASMLLTVALHREQGVPPDYSIAVRLQEHARKTGKPIRQFETASEHMNVLADMPGNAQVDMLRATLADARAVPDHIGVLRAAWKSGDTRALDRILNEPLRVFPDTYDRLFVRHFETWLPQIEQMIADDKTYFIAVNSASLVGKDGIIARLRAKGYRVAGP